MESKKFEPPQYGLKLKLNHVYPEKRTPDFVPSYRIIYSLIMLVIRYIWYWIKCRWNRIPTIMNFISPLRSKQIYGVPLGGIGSGTIGRGFRGEFCRFHMKPGVYEDSIVEANQFIVTIKNLNGETILHSLLSSFHKTTLSAWKSTIDPEKCFYTGLYPRAWTEYDLSEYGIKLICRQISPIIPHDYKNSCLPCAVFEWNIENISSEKLFVTIAFTFKNGSGNKKEDQASTCSSKPLSYTDVEGVILHHTIDKMACSYTLAAKIKDNMKISTCLAFDPNSDGSEPWNELKNNGEFNKTKIENNQMFGEMACGIAAKTCVSGKDIEQIEMVLVWDMPNICFLGKKKTYNKFYTKYFGNDSAAPKIAAYALENYKTWEKSICEWQEKILNDEKLPNWYKTAIFNETYYVSDGGSLWLTLDESEMKKLSDNDPRKTYGRFSYLEGHEYIMFNTYDVHFYASHALHKNWPYLQKSLQYDLRDFAAMEITLKAKMLFDGVTVERKYPYTVPHDAGYSGEEPYILVNSYNIHDVSRWRDLNPKFILQTYRDAILTDGSLSKEFIQDMYDICHKVMENTIKNAVNNDGLITNGGTPDQTFDAWVMTGVSAYCGGLWLGALYAMIQMADCLDKVNDKNYYSEMLENGKAAFQRLLWNGSYYNFDQSSDQEKSVMADQLCAHWYLRCCGIKDYPIFPKENVLKALKTIYQNNVMKFCDGTLGAVNGFLNEKIDECSIQSQEVWTGVTYDLAATMLFEGMTEEGFRTAGGMFNSMVEKFGLAFDTPEGIYAEKYLRSLAYMRPLSIWSMQIAIESTIRED